jgi:ATP dependent DNA ligase domain
MRTSGWTPSIVPNEDQDVCLVIDDLGQLGQVYREADVDAAGLARDISARVAVELRRRCDLEMRDIPAGIQDFSGIAPGRTTPAYPAPQLIESNFDRNFLSKRHVKALEFCNPTRGTKVPQSPDWLHEIKYDGYRLRVERNGDRVRLITRNGYDWTGRFPWIVSAALKNRTNQFVIDGEAVILGVDGVSDFNALHSGKHNEEAQLYAFDVLATDGEDLHDLPLSIRKANLARLLRPARRHVRCALRTGRDRSGSLPSGV